MERVGHVCTGCVAGTRGDEDGLMSVICNAGQVVEVDLARHVVVERDAGQDNV